MQAEIEQLKIQITQDEENRRCDTVVLAGDIATLFRILTDAGIEAPAPTIAADFCSVEQYGRRHHISPEAVLSRIRRKTVEAKKGGGGQWLIKCTV